VAQVETVLFDLDGTLIDTIDLIRSSMRYATEAVLGQSLPDDVLMRNVGVPLIVQMREFDPERAEELVLVYRRHNAHVHDAMVREYPGVEETLEHLTSQGRRLGIVTSKSRAVAMRGLDRFSLGRFFDTIITADDVPVHKPDPYPLIEAAQQLGVSPSGCAYVGDSPHDMTAAIGAGCVSIAALWGAFTRERVLEPGPTHAATRITDLVPLLSANEECYRV
jgi:pyrophosphatase PpaX